MLWHTNKFIHSLGFFLLHPLVEIILRTNYANS